MKQSNKDNILKFIDLCDAFLNFFDTECTNRQNFSARNKEGYRRNKNRRRFT